MDAAKVKAIKGRAPLRASSAIRKAQRERGRGSGSLVFAYCPKAERDYVFPSDLQFLHALHLEGDESIASYDADPDRIVAFLGTNGYVGSKPDAITRAHDGRQCMVEVKYQKDLENDLRAQLQVQAQQQAAARSDMDWCAYTDLDAMAEARWLNDWLQITGLMGHCRGKVHKALIERVQAYFQGDDRCSLADIQAAQLDAWLEVFCAIFYLVQKGKLSSDLKDRPLSGATQLWLRKP